MSARKNPPVTDSTQAVRMDTSPPVTDINTQTVRNADNGPSPLPDCYNRAERRCTPGLLMSRIVLPHDKNDRMGETDAMETE